MEWLLAASGIINAVEYKCGMLCAGQTHKHTRDRQTDRQTDRNSSILLLLLLAVEMLLYTEKCSHRRISKWKSEIVEWLVDWLLVTDLNVTRENKEFYYDAQYT